MHHTAGEWSADREGAAPSASALKIEKDPTRRIRKGDPEMDLVLLTSLCFCWVAGAVMGGLIAAVVMLQMKADQEPDLTMEAVRAPDETIYTGITYGSDEADAPKFPDNPCQLCAWYPPSKGGGKPCKICPAEGRKE